MEVKFGLELALSGIRALLRSIKWAVGTIPKKAWKIAGLLALLVIVPAIVTVVTVKVIAPRPPDAPLISDGGLDLQQYCVDYRYDKVNVDSKSGDAFCSSNIDLDSACNWQYSGVGLLLKLQDPSDPYTGTCYDRGKSLGGISNMSGYCKYIRSPGSPSAIVMNQTWICRLKVDTNVACNLQYNRSGEAAQYKDGAWMCYRPA